MAERRRARAKAKPGARRVSRKRRPPASVSEPDAVEEPDPAVHTTHPFPVIGVGASAGGLEAFTGLLRAIPAETPAAIVLVQHLARGHESLLPELLGQITSLPVVRAHDGVQLEPGHVYIIAPDTRMSVFDGRLAVRPRLGNWRAADSPIDLFLRSLADHYREKAIGVILTGAAHDGALGIREIKASGGITIAQDPDEASVDSMPRAAIATGAVDLVLPVARIAEELVRLAGHPFLATGASQAAPEPAPEADGYRRLFQLLRRGSGVDFTLYKSPTLVRRIHRRMALDRLVSLDSYLELLQQNPAEVEHLYEDILIHVTSFFREPESFGVLAERIARL